VKPDSPQEQHLPTSENEPDLMDRVDAECEQFEDHRQSGEPPEIANYLDGWEDPQRGVCLNIC